MQTNEHMDIAIVGMACRFPGARNYHEYWQNLIAGRNSIREVPPDRWDWRRYFGDPRVEPNKTNVRWGGFIDDVDKFDPLFFGIAPNEAAFIDPQHRLFLEAAWHAVEDAGYSIASLAGKSIGVYAGVSKNDYGELMRETRHEILPYVSTGTVHSILANRVSFFLNVHGKSEAVDTACSSSFVALHNAVRDIAAGDCEAAIVGGVNALITPTMFISHSRSGFLSPDGQCKTFSAGANGYVRSEGVGAVFIKPLHAALRDGDHVHAVIKSTAINHGGRANFLTSPTTEAQAAVVMNALRRRDIDPRTVDYIEAHGTGTPLGDPIEINGLKRAFAQLTAESSGTHDVREPYCALSAVKTNIGHLESAAGMAGMIKVVLAMQHGQIPGICHFDRLNPYIELDGSPFYIARENVAWEKRERPRRAGVSSFGMGGVNAHVVLEEAPEVTPAAAAEREHVFVLSAKKGRLRSYAEALLGHLRGGADAPLRDIAYTLQNGRDAYDERLAVTASSKEELLSGLQAFVDGAGAPNLVTTDDAQAPAGAAAQWVRGGKVEWSELHRGESPRRVPLPPYPFARKRCWFTDVPSRVIATVEPEPAPLVHAEPLRTLRPTDFFIRDHVVQGKPMLPAVVHMELARAVASARDAERARVLKDVYWITPVVVDGNDVEVEVRLTPQDDRLSFEIVRGGMVHSKGSLGELPADAREPRKVDIAAVRSRCGLEKNKPEVYSLLAAHGLAYGSSFQSIDRCVHNEHEILAELRVPDDARAGRERFVLQPSIMDGVFQAVTALSLLGIHRLGKQFVPFHLESVEIMRPTADRCFVYATVNSARGGDGKLPSFNATLTDEEGNVLVNIRNLQKRPIAERQESAALPVASRDVYYRPVWHRKELEQRAGVAARTLLLFAHDDSLVPAFRKQWPEVVLVRPGASYREAGERVYDINPGDLADHERLLQVLRNAGLTQLHVVDLWGLDLGDDDDVRAAMNLAVYNVLQLTRAAIRTRFRDNVNLVHVHRPGEGIARSIHSMVAGFARTLKYENPKFDYVTLGIDDVDPDALARAVSIELGAASNAGALREVLYRGGRRYERTVVREAISARPEAGDVPIRQGGVYVIAGGAGGLGALFSRYLAANYSTTVLWLGRSAVTPVIEERIREVESAGGKCEYFSADITDREALSRVFAAIRERHPRIHGVIHAAALIEDAFILRKERDSFARVVEPKVLGAIHLDALTAGDELDFFLVFSSIAALMPNQGQCDYAAANSFLDSFVEARNALAAARQRSGVSVALNWPLWANGGIRVSADEERHLLRVFGMRPLPTPEGLAIFEASLAHARQRFPEVHQIIACDGDREKIAQCLGVTAAAEERETADAPSGTIQDEIRAIFAARLGLGAEVIDADRTIGELGVDSASLIGVIRDINDRFDAGVNPTLLFDVNTVSKLAAHLTAIGKTEAVAKGATTPPWNRSLIDVERSDPARLTFSKTFQTSAFYLRDHVVDGQYNMPGACYVEMARQAGDLVLGPNASRRLLHNYWASPLSSPKEDFTAYVHLTEKADHLAYEIVSYGPAGEKRLHAMGQIAREDAATQPETRIVGAQVTARCDEIQYPPRIYEQIRGEGLIVARSFEPMKHIHLNDGEALAVLELSEEVRSTAGEYVLHPALLTGAFQAALISNRRKISSDRQYIPIGMDELEILAPIPPECQVYCRPRPGNARNEEMRKYDVEICRPDGVVVVRLKGFAIRALKAAAASAGPRTSAAEAPSLPAGNALLAPVQDLIKSKLAHFIGVAAGEIDATVPFDQYGVTSIMVVELNQVFEQILGPIPKTLFFEYRNISELAEYFVQNHGEVLGRLLREKQEAPPAPAVIPAQAADPAAEARAFLRSLIAGPIGLPAEEIDFHAGFDQYGVNSVMVVELNEIFERIFGPLSKTLFFEYRSVDELAQYFLENHRDRLLAALPKKETIAEPAATPVAIEAANSRVTMAARPHSEDVQDIAIVSAAGRFPGARNLRELWDVLREGRDCITEIPPDRFDFRKYYDADPEQNRIYAKWGGFIDDVDRFDSGFFNISPREAELTDPQERILLEVVWEMLEHAGYTRQRLLSSSERRVGVFVGALWQGYEGVGIEATLAGNVVGPSSLLYSIANRISYYLDLAGPSMAIDTACSSSLTALHVACQSIRAGESRYAIVAGVNLSLTASKYLFLSRGRFLSTDGRCRSYGAGGDGYVPGEGICAVLLKPLADAVADGDSVLAVIKGSAINHGGRTNGYTVPNPKAQGNVIAEALEHARIDPRNITYIDGHGTGTSLGDPIEIAGLEKALGPHLDGDRICAIGSIKSNIGHLEAAAGLASVIKVLLQLQHEQLAPTLHTDRLNPNIDFSRSLFRVQRELGPWPRLDHGRRCAGVSSFGAGGSNGHVILEEYDGPLPPRLGSSEGPALFVFSARNEDRLFALLRNFDEYLRDAAPGDLHDIAWTLQAGREAMRERLAIVAGSIGELRAAIQEVLQRTRSEGNWRRGRTSGRGDGAPAVAFESIEQWWAARNLVAVAEAWVQGAEIDWPRLYGGRKYGFLPLPTYPFARERHWIETTTVAHSLRPAILHPLLHSNTSDVNGLRYTSKFTGEEFFFAEHMVRLDGRTFEKVLPGVACLEMARAAIEDAWPARPDASVLELRNVVWAQPIVAYDEKQLHIALSSSGNDRIDYRIYSEEGGREIVHSQGRALWTRQTDGGRVDLARLAGKIGEATIETNSVYGAFLRTGGYYGPSFQGIASIEQGREQSLVHLRLPASVEETLGDYVLHPTLMDSALQAYLGLIEDWFNVSGQTRMPFALESLRIHGRCQREMVAWMRYAPDSRPGDHVIRLDVDLCDPQGRVCARMRGFGVRPVSRASLAATRRPEPAVAKTTSAMPLGLVTLAPVWDPVQIEPGEARPRAGERTVVIGGDAEQHAALLHEVPQAEVIDAGARATVDEIAEELRRGPRVGHVLWLLPRAKRHDVPGDAIIEEQEEGVMLGFRVIKALLREGYGAGELGWTVVTNRAQRVAAERGEEVDATHGSVDGLVGSMAKEYRNWKIRLIDTGAGPWPWPDMLRLDADARGDGWAYRDGQWYRRRLVPCDLGDRATASSAPCQYKRGGVYVVIGGAGGLGEAVSEYLIRNYDARIVWIGRRAKDAAIEAKLQRLAAIAGQQPLYITADARKREDLERALSTIRERHERIDGVIHSVVVLADKSLGNMSEEQFRSALSSKVDVTVRAAQVFGREPLDFILYFSSLQSFLKAPGQSNYAAGCTFEDAFAEWQGATAPYPVKVMNWGYWGSIGVATTADVQQRMARIGWGSLETDEGMAALEALLRGPLNQVGIMRAIGAEAVQTMEIAAGERLSLVPEAAPSVLARLANVDDAADAVRRYVEERRKEGETQIRLLESADGPSVLRTLGGHQQDIAEYAAIDVERDTEQQQIARGAYDVVVVHEARSPRQAVRNVKAALKENGLLVVTVPGAERVVEEEGFRARVSGAVIVGESDGLIRQRRETPAKPPSKPAALAIAQPVTTVATDAGLVEKVEHWLVDAVGVLLKIRREDVDPDAELSEFGFDSITLTALANHVNQAYALELMPTIFFEHPTVRSFARHLVNAHGEKVAAKLVRRERPVVSAAMVETSRLLDAVEDWLIDAVGVLLKLRRENVDPDAELGEFGFDSITLTALANHVNQHFGLELMPTIFFEHPSVRSFARHLVDKYAERVASKFADRAPVVPAAAAAAEEQPHHSRVQEKAEQWLVDAVCVLLKVRREDVDLDAELGEFGFDSITLTALANQVNQTFGLELMPTIFFEHPSVRAFARHLVEAHGERLLRVLRVEAAPAAREEDQAHRAPKRGKAQWGGRDVAALMTAEDLQTRDGDSEPIAIIGMSGRFPGAEDLYGFWENLYAGRDSITEIPRHRWDWEAMYGNEREDGNKSSVKWGAFIEGVDQFDPLFFGISPREAELMDPQHRLTMMYGWKTFEDAGYGPRQLWGSRTGVFIGTTNTGYTEQLTQARAGIEGYTATGLVPSVAPNRLSFLLNLHGPSEPIETACSSSLVAVHRAVRAIRAGECDMALAGGVNTLFPTLHISFNKAGMLSPDGKCKTFSARANGYVRGEGVGMVVLKRLSEAERDGDHIYGVIRGSAENHGGRAQSLTAPNPQAQAELIKEAFRRAGVSPRTVTYVEAHGTGTPLGDPVEVNGLRSAFQSLYEEMGEEAATGYCGLGSVKTNIGHLELAAGIAGLMKILLQMKHRTLVPSLHCEEINPYVRLEGSPFYIVRETRPWNRLRDEQGRELPLRAGVSSFGFGGANAHVVVEEYIGNGHYARRAAERGPAMIVLSGKDAERLREQAVQLRQWIARGEAGDRDLPGIAYTLQAGREAMDHRLALTVTSLQELDSRLADFLDGKSGIEGLHLGEVKRNNETLSLFRGDEELREAVAKWMQRGKWSKLLDLWVRGLDVDWERLYGDDKPRRVSLPTYPFARERCWIDAAPDAPVTVRTDVLPLLHPLLHHNTSDLSEQRYTSTFTGDEFFLRDHRIRTDGGTARRVLPGVAYLEMARAAVEHASPSRPDSAAVELRDNVWLKPIIAGAQDRVSIALFAEDDGQIAYEIYSGAADERTIHCQGEAALVEKAQSQKVDLERLTGSMHATIEAADLYGMWSRLGIDYGPAHQGVAVVHIGDGALLARLRLPQVVEATRNEFVLHPSVMDSALQASLALLADPAHLPARPPVPFALDALRVLAPCATEMVAWVRQAGADKSRLDIDLCDRHGNVCVQMRGFAARTLEVDVRPAAQSVVEDAVEPKLTIRKPDSSFDEAFYEKLIAGIVNREVSVDDAADLG